MKRAMAKIMANIDRDALMSIYVKDADRTSSNDEDVPETNSYEEIDDEGVDSAIITYIDISNFYLISNSTYPTHKSEMTEEQLEDENNERMDPRDFLAIIYQQMIRSQLVMVATGGPDEEC